MTIAPAANPLQAGVPPTFALGRRGPAMRRRVPPGSGQPSFNPRAGLSIGGVDFTPWLETRSPRLRSTLSPYTGVLSFRLTGALPFASRVLASQGSGGTNAYWKLEEAGGAGAVYVDQTGQATGVAVGNPVPVPGPLAAAATALQFDGSSYVAMRAADYVSWSPPVGPFTVEAAVKIAAPPGGPQGIVDCRPAGGLSGFALIVDATGLARFTIASGGGGRTVTGGPSICDGNWHLARGVWSGTGPGSSLDLYVDGVLVNSNTGAGNYGRNTGAVGLLVGGSVPASNLVGAVGQVSVAWAALGGTEPAVRYSCLAGLPSLPVVEQDVTWNIGGVLYSGRVRNVVPDDVGRLDWQTVEVDCQDYTTLLDLDVCATARSAPQFNPSRTIVEPDQQRVQWLLDSFGKRSITTRHVQSLYAALPAADYTGMTLTAALQNVLSFSGGSFYVDYAKDLHTYLDEKIYAPFSLSDLHDDVASFGFKDLLVPSDSIDLHNALYAIPGRSVVNPDSVTELITSAQGVSSPGVAAVLVSLQPSASGVKISEVARGAFATAAGASISPAFGAATQAGNTLIALVTATTAGGTGNVGQTGAATFSYDFSGVNSDNVEASGPYTIGVHGSITSVSCFFGGYTAAVNARLCIWNSATGALLANSAQFSCPQGRALRTQAIANLDAPSGTSYYIGFWRDRAKDATWGVRSSGTFKYMTNQAGVPSTFSGANCSSPYACGEMQAYATYSIVGGAITTAAAGWVLEGQADASLEESTVWIKRGADSAAGETAPTFTATSGTNMYAQLLEVAGCDPIAPLDNVTTQTGVATTASVVMPQADSGFSDLVLLATRWPLAGAATATFQDTFASVAAAVGLGNSGATSIAKHSCFSYGIVNQGGAQPTWYENAASIAKYGRKEASLTNSSILSQPDLDALGAAYLANYANPRQQGHATCWKPGLTVGQRLTVTSSIYAMPSVVDSLGNYTALIQAVNVDYAQDDSLPEFQVEFAAPTLTMAVQIRQLASQLASSSAASGTTTRNPYVASAYRSASTTYPAGTNANVVAFDSVNYDPSSAFDVTVHPGRYTVPVSGYYSITARIAVSTNANPHTFHADIYKNGARIRVGNDITFIAAGAFEFGVGVAATPYLNAGDYIEIVLLSTAGFTTTNGPDTTWVDIAFLGTAN